MNWPAGCVELRRQRLRLVPPGGAGGVGGPPSTGFFVFGFLFSKNQNAKTYPYPRNLAKLRPSEVCPVSTISGKFCALRAQNYVLILESGRIFEG